MSKIRTEQIKQSEAANGSLLSYRADVGAWIGQTNVSITALTANGTTGTSGQILASNGSGIYWANPASGSGDGVVSFSYTNANNTLTITTTGSTYTANIQPGLEQAFSNATAFATIAASNAYNDAVSYTNARSANTFSNAVAFATTIANTAYTNAVSVAAADATTKSNQAYINAIAYADSRAATAYTNAIAFSGNASLAYANAVTYADGRAAVAYSNGVTFTNQQASQSYTNAVSVATSLASNAFTNAVSAAATDATTKANQAYSNAIAYAASNTYVNNTFAPRVSPSFTGNVSISGNLTVTGTTTYINTTNLDVGDNIITLNADIGAVPPTENAGIEVSRGSSSNVGIRWNETTDEWEFTNDGTTYQRIASFNEVNSAYTNAIAYAANAFNIMSGTINPGRLPHANTTSNGAVVLLDSVSNTSISIYAPTMNAVKTAFDAAVAANGRATSAQTAAINAFTNAIAYAASNTYVNDTFAPKASPTFTGFVTLPIVVANNSSGALGQVLTSNGAGVYWSDPAGGEGAADIAYANAIAYADAKSGEAFSNAVSYVDANFATVSFVTSTFAPITNPSFSGIITLSPRLFANGATGTTGQVLTSGGTTNVYWSTPANAAALAATAYSNAIAFSGNAALAYANAVTVAAADATTKANQAYSNAIAYAASNTYVNTQLALKANLASPTFTGTVILPTVSANGSTGSAGQVLTTSGTGVYWSTPASGSGNADTAYANAIAYAASNTYVNTQLALKANVASPTFTGNTQINSLGVGTSASGLTGDIRATGDITAYFSDERLKEIVGEVTGALEAVKQIKTFKYKPNELAQSYGFDGNKVEIGISAQSLQKVYPELTKLAPFDSEVVDGKYVSRSGEEYLTAAYERLTVILIEAVKELADIVENKLK